MERDKELIRMSLKSLNYAGLKRKDGRAMLSWSSHDLMANDHAS